MLFTLLVPPPYRERYINPYHYSPLETWKGDEKGNRDENGSKKEGLKKPQTKPLHSNKTLKAPGGDALKHIPPVPSLASSETLLAAVSQRRA